MSKFHYTEIFFSLQGEGRFQGSPSIFFRTYGCNFRCKKFGRDKNELIDGPNPEVATIIENIDKYEKFEELPLVNSGCDTYSSIYPEFKRFAKKKTHTEITDEFINLLPENKWNKVHLVITGGEPLLGWQKSYPDLLEDDRTKHHLQHLTFETNGTQHLTPELETYLFEEFTRSSRDYENLTFSVSPKLSVSGEKWEDAIKPDVIRQFQSIGHTYLKFVVASEKDVQEAHQAVNEYRKAGFEGDVYLMAVGGTHQIFTLNNKNIAELALKQGWKYSDRLQVLLWKNAWST